MAEQDAKPSGPDLSQGVALADLADGGMLVGHVGDDAGAAGAPRRRGLRGRRHLHALQRPARRRADGRRHGALPVAPRLLQPAHRRGAARAGARARSHCWSVEQRDGKVFVRGEARGTEPSRARKPRGKAPDKIVIVGGGAAGFAAAEMLRRQQLPGQHRHAERRRCAARRPAEPVQGLPRRQRARGVDPAARRRLLRRAAASTCGSKADVAGIDARAREVALGDGSKVAYDRLLLATGAEPVRLPIPGRGPAARPHAALARRQPRDHRAGQDGATRGRDRRELHRARGRGLAARARPRGPRRGAGEAAAGARPRAASWATSCARCTRSTASSSTSRTRRPRSTRRQVTLKSGGTLDADLVVVGVGVRPRLALAEKAGLDDRSRRGRRRLPGDQRAGHLRGRRHRALARPAQRRRRSASSTGWSPSARARPPRSTCSAAREKFDAVPFFWSQHYDVPINYVGHAETWDELAIDGDIAGKDCLRALQARRPHARRRLDLPRRREPAGRGGDGAGERL